jgi:hypothetical protein
MPTVIAPAMSAWTLSANTLILVLSMIGSGVMSGIGFYLQIPSAARVGSDALTAGHEFPFEVAVRGDI